MNQERTPPYETPGTSLSDEDFRSGVIAVEHEVQAFYAWDAGIAIGRLLREMREGNLVGRACHQCRRILFPPRMYCEECFRPTDEWMPVSDTGTVNTFSLAHVRWDMAPLEQPEIPAVIEIDGASTGMGFMHKLGNVDPDAVHIGMRVRAVWKPPEEREGAITDILHFEPIGG